MKRMILAATMVAAATLPGVASAMTVEQFLMKAHGLKSKGVFAIGSRDLGLIKGEMEGIVTAYRHDVSAARAEGRTPPSCPPPKGRSRMKSGDFIRELEAIPPASRGISMKTAFYAIMQKHYPC